MDVATISPSKMALWRGHSLVHLNSRVTYGNISMRLYMETLTHGIDAVRVIRDALERLGPSNTRFFCPENRWVSTCKGAWLSLTRHITSSRRSTPFILERPTATVPARSSGRAKQPCFVLVTDLAFELFHVPLCNSAKGPTIQSNFNVYDIV